MSLESLKKNDTITHLKSIRIWWGIIFLLIPYYFFAFGFEMPWENLFGNYSRRIYYTTWGRVQQNVPLLPDKFVTLLGLGGSLIYFLLHLARVPSFGGNIFFRLLWLVGLVALLPLSLYLLTYASILVLIAMVLGAVWFLLQWLIRGKFGS
jgi:hypothetical protein